MSKKKRPGRPKGSKNKTTKSVMEMAGITESPIRRRPGRPAGIKSRKRGRPAGSGGKGRNSSTNSLLTTGKIKGIHFIGRTLIVDTNTMNIDEVIFLGEGKSPKIR